MTSFECVYCSTNVMWSSVDKYIDGIKHTVYEFRESFETAQACASCTYKVENTRAILIEKDVRFNMNKRLNLLKTKIMKTEEETFEVYFISDSNRHISGEPILVKKCEDNDSYYVVMKDYNDYEHPDSGEKINLSKGEKISVSETMRYKK